MTTSKADQTVIASPESVTAYSLFVEHSAGSFFPIILKCQVSVQAKMDVVSFLSRVSVPADLTGERAVR